MKGLKVSFFVATNGNDKWSGKIAKPNAEKTDGPFATLARARDAVRELKGLGLKEPITVMVRGGKYYLEEIFVLSSEDGGAQDSPITYAAYLGEEPIISGGRKLSGWKPYKENVLQADVPSSFPRFRQLFFNGQLQIRARTPNFDPENPLYGGWAFMEGLAGADAFKYKPGLFKQHVSKPTQAEVYFFVGPRGSWGSTIVPIKAIDEEKRIIYTDYKAGEDRSLGFTPNIRFRVENILEELDRPGEWCLDSKGGRLYFWPPGPLDEASEVVAPALDSLLVLRGARWITISGFTFTETLAGDAVRLEDAEHICIEKNHIYAVGGRALVLFGRKGQCARNLIQGNEIGYAGECGIYVGGRACLNEILDNDIHHCGFINKYAAGIEFPFYGGTHRDVSEKSFTDGNLIAHNHIHDLPRDGVQLGANPYGRNIVEYNLVQRTCLETFDSGGIRSHMFASHTVENFPDILKDVKMVGHIIRYNLITDTVGCHVENGKIITPSAWPVFAIYLDELSGNCVVYGNIVVRSGFGAIINPGKNNTIENNIFVDCKYQICLQVIGQWTQYDIIYGYATDNRVLRNVFYTTESEVLDHLKSPYPFTFRYIKDIKRILEQSDYNLFFRADGMYKLLDWQRMGYDVHSEIGNPMFVDPEHGDYRLKPESPAFKLGFKPIEVDKIGMRVKEKTPR